MICFFRFAQGKSLIDPQLQPAFLDRRARSSLVAPKTAFFTP
jgi:hypothetical protein